MGRKLIEMRQEYSIVCDNKQCDYKVKNHTGSPNEDISSYINAPCPKCGENLLTEQDYLQSLKFLKVVNWLNNWFSWTTFFLRKKAKTESTFVHFHNGVHIEKANNN
jgi:hypothetical protein